MHSAQSVEQALLTESRPWRAVSSVPERPSVQRQEELPAQPWELPRAAVEQPSELLPAEEEAQP